MGKALEGIHALYMENYVCGQILHLHRKGLSATTIAKELGVGIGFVERTVRNRFGPKPLRATRYWRIGKENR